MNSIFITARVASTRLPAKAIKKIKNKTAIEYVIQRAKLSKKADNIVLCTTHLKEDDVLEDIAFKNNIKCTRGSITDKLGRWLQACKEHNTDAFVCMDADDLFCDPGLTDLAFDQLNTNDLDFIEGKGIICGSFSYAIRASALKKVCEVKDSDDTEMMWEYFTQTNLFKVSELKKVPDAYCRNDVRLTLDYKEDLDLFSTIINEVNDLDLLNIIKHIDANPSLKKINSHLHNEWSENQKQKTDIKLNSKYLRFSNNERKYLDEVLTNGFAAGECGSMTERLEVLFAKRHNQNYAIGFNSGTSTLHAALESFGVTAGDEVIIPGLTVAMCGYAVWHCGATPVFADIKEDTFLIDPVDVEKKITPKTKAIMVVHLYGLMCDMDAIMSIAKKHNLYVLEDCAQCFLSTDHKNRIAGTVGDVGSWSFENSKHLSCGDGGIVTTNNKKFAKHMRQFGGVGFKNITESSGKVRIDRNKFQNPNWKRHNIMAYNYRLPEICAAVALAQTEKIDYFCQMRKSMFEDYKSIIEKHDSKLLTPQFVPEGYVHSCYSYAVLFNDQLGVKWEDFRLKYIENGGDGIFAAWQTVNNEPCFQENKIGYGSIPIAEKIQKNIMQFTSNQLSPSERLIQKSALEKTLDYFHYKI